MLVQAGSDEASNSKAAAGDPPLVESGSLVPTPSSGDLSPSVTSSGATPSQAPLPSKAPLRPQTSALPRSSTATPERGARDLGGCPVAPPDSVWRTRVDRLPVSARSAAYVNSIGWQKELHADFGSGTWEGAPLGIPITSVPAGSPSMKVSFDYSEESDKGPYHVPADALVEGGSQATGDRHVIALDKAACKVYELYNARPSRGGWHAGSGAIFDLNSNTLRPAGWTSADAAGLPILPGLARYDEAASGNINHALRITVPRSQQAYLWPARHEASNSTDKSLPPMGLRLRLKANVDISKLPPQAKVIAQALKSYGAIVADNGSAWYVSGTQDDRWNNDALHKLAALRGSDFEAVDVSGLQKTRNSGASRQPRH